MKQTASNPASAGKEIPETLRPVLISLGRGLGTVAVYGSGHPTVEQIINQTFDEMQCALQNRKTIAIGTFNGSLTIDDEPVSVQDVPVRTLEKRLVSLKISHLSLTRGLTRDELKKLLSALCAPSDTQMKETLSGSGLDHVEVADVKYVALRKGEQKTGSGGGSEKSAADSAVTDGISAPRIGQIIAFLKGESASDASGEVKKMLSDPERLGQMIMEAAAIRQTAVSTADGESLADIVVGCLRRTYDGIKKETEFQSPQGKVNLTKAMMLLEKNVLDKIHAALGTRHPEMDRRIFDAIREMEEDRQLEMLATHYYDQRRKLYKTEEKLIENIRRQGAEKAREQAEDSGIPTKDWQRLMVKAGVEQPSGGGADIGALAVVLEKLEGLMKIQSSDPAQVRTTVAVTRNGLNTYTNRIESRIQELEGQVTPDNQKTLTVEDHAEHLDREALMMEVSTLTLSLLQPLTVINASVEAALRYAEKDIQKELLDLAYESGKRMQELTRRMMLLVGYPVLESKA